MTIKDRLLITLARSIITLLVRAGDTRRADIVEDQTHKVERLIRDESDTRG